MFDKKKIGIIIAVLLAVVLSVTFASLNKKGVLERGNNPKYSVENVTEKKKTPLKDDLVIFIGSDFTCGIKSSGESFVDYIKKADGIDCKKYAQKDIYLVDKGETSVISLLHSIPTDNYMPYLIMCEIPYKDTSFRAPIGKLEEGYNIKDYNTRTIIGAMEYIVAYCQSTWSCPVVFYTCPKNDNNKYAEIVDALYKVKDKWNLEIIDFYSDKNLIVSKDDSKLYLSDQLNPTKAGYKEFYTPVFEDYLYKWLIY